MSERKSNSGRFVLNIVKDMAEKKGFSAEDQWSLLMVITGDMIPASTPEGIVTMFVFMAEHIDIPLMDLFRQMDLALLQEEN